MKKTINLLVVLAAAALTAACGPAPVKPIETAGPNETVFVIPLEGDSTAQKQVQSVEYLKAKMVQSKRIEIPIRERSTGRMPWDYEWLPTVRVIKVDRSLQTRQWSGVKGANAGIHVESLESINFHVGFNVTALIQEEDAATYLYWHAGKQLSEIVDSNVHGYIQDIAAREFGRRKLEDCKAEKNAVFALVEKEAKEHFKKYGITIVSLGNAGGLDFDDEAIQTAINKTQTKQMEVQVAEQERQAQEKRNQTNVARATAERQAAEEFAKAKDAQVAKIQLDIDMVRAQATLAAANKWNGSVPTQVLPQGSNMLFGLDAPAKK